MSATHDGDLFLPGSQTGALFRGACPRPSPSRQGFSEILDRVYATGEPFVGTAMHIAVHRAPDREV